MTELSLDKNKDYVIAEHQALLSASQCSFLSVLFSPLTEESSKQSKLLSSIGSRFKQQVQALLKTLRVTKPHYVRCVKPNNVLNPAIFERKIVLRQLHCGGVMKAIRISRAGYPIRKPLSEFVDLFGILAPEVLDSSSDEFTICRRLWEKVGLMGYQICRTALFPRAGQMAQLEARRNEVLGISASIILRKMRSDWARQTFVSLLKYTMLIQALSQAQLARLANVSVRREVACLRIQKNLRKHIARKAYKDLYNSAICIQTGLRGMAARHKLRLRKQIKAAIVIQSHCRKYLARVQYLNTKKAAITTQCAWRGRVARKELRKLKMASRETRALQAAINKLEKQVEELTSRLQEEKRMRADFEVSMNRKNANLQSALNDIQLQFKQTKELLSSEIEKLKEQASKKTCWNLWKRVCKCTCFGTQ